MVSREHELMSFARSIRMRKQECLRYVAETLLQQYLVGRSSNFVRESQFDQSDYLAALGCAPSQPALAQRIPYSAGEAKPVAD